MIEGETATERAARLGGYELLEPLSDSFFGLRHRVRREEGSPMRAARVIADAAAGPIDAAAAALCNVRHPLLVSPIEINAQCGKPDPDGNGPCVAQMNAAAGGSRDRVNQIIAADDPTEPLARAIDALRCTFGTGRRGSGPCQLACP